MGDNYRDSSSDTMGGNSTDPMDISGGEETENEYFHEAVSYGDNMDQSIDNLQGGLRLPMFALDQSTGLQGSRGFQISSYQSEPQMDRSSSCDELKTELVSDSAIINQQVFPGISTQSLIHPAFSGDGQMTSFNVFNLQASSVSCTVESSSFVSQGNFNVLSVTGKPVLTEPSVFGAGSAAYTFSNDKIGPIVQTRGGEKVGGSFEGIEKTDASDAQDVGNRNKTSPKGKGKKNRPCSSTSSEVASKQEPPATGLTRVEWIEQGSGEPTFKPSLLDEILTDKKLSLMRSPQVIRFLQAQQETLAREKAFITGQTIDS